MNKPEKMKSEAPRLGEMGLENFAPYLMNRIIGRYNAAMSSEMAELGLTTPQMRSLAVLSVIDGILSRALDTLNQNGLIRRETDEQDSRATRVFITDAGREAYERLWPHMSQAYDAMFKGIDAAEKRAFVGTLQTILRNIRKHDF
jgi:DNA-binding MarR family transcriptional regulator